MQKLNIKNRNYKSKLRIKKLNQFTKKVLSIVLQIPIGQVRSYLWVAKKAGKPGAARAVGQIMKNNPYPLIIPCHRVINNNGKFGGYALGVATKRKLLSLEKEIVKCLQNKE